MLAAEIMGHYRSYQVLGTLGASLTTRRIRSSTGCASRWRRRRERIFRLLKILYPEHDLHSAYVGLQSDDPVVHDNAVEFMDSVLPPEVRALVIPLFDRDVQRRGAHRAPPTACSARRSAIAKKRSR